MLHNHTGPLIRILHRSTEQTITTALEAMELTAAQGRVLGYLAHCKEPPCPSDVEEVFQLTHPTVSGLLSRLEQKGFVELRADADDKRRKRIHILPKGWQCHDRIRQTIMEHEEQMLGDFSPQERELFQQLLRRAIRNMGHCPTHPNSKEERL